VKTFVFLTLLILPGCGAALPEHVALQPAAQDVDIAFETPSQNAYKDVGKISGEGAGKELDEAQTAARNDLRNKAAALGASLVTIDQETGEGVLLQGKTLVTLVGHAYKSVD
jgi:hypothetical protein